MLVSCDLVDAPLLFEDAEEVFRLLQSITEGWSFAEAPASDGVPSVRIRSDGHSFEIMEEGCAPFHEPSAVSAACSLVVILLNRMVADDPDFLALHAGAVTIGERTIVFPSTHRAGKSTLAAALAFNGHRLIADDILPVDCREVRASAVACGVAPRLRLPLPPSRGFRYRFLAWRWTGPDDGYYRYLRLPPSSRCRFGERFEIGAFLFLERNASHCEPQLCAVSKSHAMKILLLQNFGTAAPPGIILDRVETLSRLNPAFVMRFSDVGAAASMLGNAFGQSERPCELWTRLDPAEPDLASVAGLDCDESVASKLPERIVCHRDGVVARETEGSIFLADQANGGIFALDPLGSAIWELMEEPACTREIAAKVCQVFPDTMPEIIAADVDRLIGQLLENGLVTETRWAGQIQ